MAKRPTLDHEKWNRELAKQFGTTVTTEQIDEFAKAHPEVGAFPFQWIRRNPNLRLGRGKYRIPDAGEIEVSDDGEKFVVTGELEDQPVDLPEFQDTPAVIAARQRLENIKKEASQLSVVPRRESWFVPFGDYDMIEKVIASRMFFPIYVVGPTGGGKTVMVRQACANQKREYIRCNITTETDEDDLLGGFRLRANPDTGATETVFELGPALIAMLRGAVLLLDEIDLASQKIMCLQPILEGQPVTVKKLGMIVEPAAGFTVIATANTKGRGDDSDGSYVGTGQLNKAFLNRFAIHVEQEYPSPATEKKMLVKAFEAEGGVMTKKEHTFFDVLVKWAETTRVTFQEQAVEDLIATRQLVHIVRAYKLFGDDEMALSYCTNCFDARTREAFLELYNKLVPTDSPSNVGGSADSHKPNKPAF